MTRELEALHGERSCVRPRRRAALEGVGLLSEAAQSLGKALQSAPDRALAVAVPFLKLCGFVLGGWLMAKAAAIAAGKAHRRGSGISTRPSCAARASTPSRCCQRRSRMRAS